MCMRFCVLYVADNTQNHHRSSKLSSSLKDSYEDADPSRVKTLSDEPDHISAKLNQHMLSADHDVASSNIASSVASDDSNNSSNTDSASLRTASHRPKTVKMLGSKMRSTGNHQTSCDPFPTDVLFYCNNICVHSAYCASSLMRKTIMDYFSYVIPVSYTHLTLPTNREV